MESYVITINEIDDVDDALEILRKEMGRQGLPGKLKANSLGIIATHADAVKSGVCKAICGELPFDTVGFASDSQSPNGVMDSYVVSIMILTANDCNFASGGTADLYNGGDVGQLVTECYRGLKKNIDEPKLCLMYTPFHSNYFPADYINAISEYDPGVPVFGAVSTDIDDVTNGGRTGTFTIYNGEASMDSVVLTLISGNFTPRFYKSSFNDEAVKVKDIGRVTKSDRNILAEIDDVPAVEFLRNIGYFGADVDNSNTGELKVSAATAASTLIFDYSKGSDVSRTFTDFTAKGEIVCMGYVHKGASLSLALAMPPTVIETTHEVVEQIKSSGSKAILIYSCIGRRLGLLNNPTAEFEIIQSAFAGKNDINYITAHVGGEICPVKATEGDGLTNCEHNLTLIACAF
jgi:hypothetical protein